MMALNAANATSDANHATADLFFLGIDMVLWHVGWGSGIRFDSRGGDSVSRTRFSHLFAELRACLAARPALPGRCFRPDPWGALVAGTGRGRSSRFRKSHAEKADHAQKNSPCLVMFAPFAQASRHGRDPRRRCGERQDDLLAWKELLVHGQRARQGERNGRPRDTLPRDGLICLP